MNVNLAVSQATIIELQKCDQSRVSAHYLFANNEDHPPRGFTDAALLGQTLRQLLDSQKTPR